MRVSRYLLSDILLYIFPVKNISNMSSRLPILYSTTEAGGSCLGSTWDVTKYTTVKDVFFRTLLCHLSQTWMCHKPTSGLLNLMLSSSLRSDKIYQCKKYYNGHALLCYLSQTGMFNKPTHGLFNKTSCLAPAFDVTKVYYFCHILLWYLSQT